MLYTAGRDERCEDCGELLNGCTCLAHIRRYAMAVTEQQRKEFEDAARPLIKYLAENFHPHMTVIVTNAHAELVEGVASVVVDDYLKD